MNKESIAFGVAGVFFGLLIGWIIGSQQGVTGRTTPAVQQASASSLQQTTRPPLDEQRAAALRQAAEQSPGNAAPRVELANLYMDAERFDEAARWYEDALRVDPRNVNASTDLAIAYYYLNQTDRSLEQFDRSLAIDPGHAKTLLNQGMVRAFGKQDLEGAARAWERVVDVAPGTPEAQRARQALDSVRTAHPDLTGAAVQAGPQGGQPD